MIARIVNLLNEIDDCFASIFIPIAEHFYVFVFGFVYGVYLAFLLLWIFNKNLFFS